MINGSLSGAFIVTKRIIINNYTKKVLNTIYIYIIIMYNIKVCPSILYIFLTFFTKFHYFVCNGILYTVSYSYGICCQMYAT